jgi:hypothetical protein
MVCGFFQFEASTQLAVRWRLLDVEQRPKNSVDLLLFTLQRRLAVDWNRLSGQSLSGFAKTQSLS